MSRDIPEAWDQSPPPESWFDFGEAFAHLKYLENEGEVQRQIQQQTIVLSLA
jgi:hypothetical protein